MADSNVDSILEEVLKEIKPTAEEHAIEMKIVEEIESRLKSMGAKPILVGSLAKGTDISTNKDIDVFILFNPKTDRRLFEAEGLKLGKKLLESLGSSYEIDYAEHPYVKGTYKGYTIEIVPCYDTKKTKSAVDRTPYHTQYVKKKLKEKKGLEDEIRLMKQFMRGQGVYGAEAKVQGFSGYLTELLVIYYGSFLSALKGIASWKIGETIDPENLWEDKSALKIFFPDACLIVVDPIDETRNAAAAVSRQRMAQLIVAAAEFLKSPSKEFFFPKKPQPPSKEELIQRIRSRGTKILALFFEHKKTNSNTLYSQLRKTEASLRNSIHEFGFRVMKSDFWTDENNRSVILFDFEVWRLPEVRHHLGPQIDQNPRHQEKFLEKYSANKPYISGGRWVVDIKREFTEVEALISNLLVEHKGFGRSLYEDAKAEIKSGEAILDLSQEDYFCFLDRFLPPLVSKPC